MVAMKQTEERGTIYAQHQHSAKGIEVGEKLEALDIIAKDILILSCKNCKSICHMTYNCKFHPITFIASYNRKCLPSECVEYVEELILIYRTLELMNRVKERSLQHEEVLKYMGLLESIHKWCITNNLHNTPFIKDYEKPTSASQASMLQEHDLMKESEEIIE
jgi:hypothetical protein